MYLLCVKLGALGQVRIWSLRKLISGWGNLVTGTRISRTPLLPRWQWRRNHTADDLIVKVESRGRTATYVHFAKLS